MITDATSCRSIDVIICDDLESGTHIDPRSGSSIPKEMDDTADHSNRVAGGNGKNGIGRSVARQTRH
jgi:hypothetical protein